ncbi:hypothetical protein [Rhizobium sp. TH2]|uniref:hypothetical protein n=1 Tax=Rhizobium sp. TH2 TaxID=2775403 RepID=UPI002156F77C|nr:hypothetical protein [Rhizobium sp. TH2]
MEAIVKRFYTAFLAVGLITLIGSSTPALGQSAKPFKVLYLSDISNHGEKALIRTRATKSHVAAIQAEINGDRALVSQLRAMNIQIRNIIGADRAMNGGMIYYVR